MNVRTSIITHPKRTPFLQLHLDFLAVCGGDYAAAKTLSVFERWTNSKLDINVQARIHNAASLKEGLDAHQDESAWIYMGIDDLSAALLGEHSKNIVNRALKRLVEEFGFLESRNNPKLKWDRKLQYRLNFTRLQAEIDRWAADPTHYAAPSQGVPGGEPGASISQIWDMPEEETSGAPHLPDLGRVHIPDLGDQQPGSGIAIPESTTRESKTESKKISAPSLQSVAGLVPKRKTLTAGARKALGLGGGKEAHQEKAVEVPGPEAPVVPPVEVKVESGTSPDLPPVAPAPLPKPRKSRAKTESPAPEGFQPMVDAIALACYPAGGVPNSEYGFIGKKAKELLASGYVPEDVVQIAAMMTSDTFWRDKITPGNLIKQAPVWKSKQRPAHRNPVTEERREVTPDADLSPERQARLRAAREQQAIQAEALKRKTGRTA